MSVDDLRTMHFGRLVSAEDGEAGAAADGGPVTRFGGRPDWLSEPEWPLPGGRPLRFVAQVRLPGAEPRMAYIFMDDGYERDFSEYGWNTDAPQAYRVNDPYIPNTVIVQPGGTPYVRTAPAAEGPTLYYSATGSDRTPVEYRVELTPYEGDPGEDAEPEDVVPWWSDVQVGGKVFWLQGDESPGDEWHHLATIDSDDGKYSINCGDAGTAYAFLNPEQTGGILIVQSC
ncbi:DUF1963 domain-containing protein [Nocardiopsis suaedae]|uniref:DUF1963 domain-containing protein n=1 Tax=Nocardiopsis suaedae TaxID=3018444 RepID=A0ABT4TDY5_9ACTN|nr:DUF1963 domain-containing protein [Nocardiopsis suaedae]MDA2802918.1 DUF1963 domain-containing protein [Nocardiopsis suaedae]